MLRFHYKWSDQEIKQAKHMQDTFEQIIHELGGIALGAKPGAEVAIGEGENAVIFDWDPGIDSGVKNVRGPRGTDIRLDGR